MVYDTEDPTLIAKMNDEMRAIESMVIVGVLKYTIPQVYYYYYFTGCES